VKKVSDEKLTSMMMAARLEMEKERRLKAATAIYKACMACEHKFAACELSISKIDRAAQIRVKWPRNIRNVGTTQDFFKDDV